MTKLMCNVCDRRGAEPEADHVKDPRRVTRRTHARFTDLIVHFRMDWSVCRGTDESCWTVCSSIDGSCWTVCAGIAGSRGGALCAINCFGAPLVGARGFLGFRPLLFGMELELPHSQALYSSLSRYCCTLDDLARASIPAHRGRHAPGRTRLAHLHVRCRQPRRKMGRRRAGEGGGGGGGDGPTLQSGAGVLLLWSVASRDEKGSDLNVGNLAT